jgi:hypothetical protein
MIARVSPLAPATPSSRHWCTASGAISSASRVISACLTRYTKTEYKEQEHDGEATRETTEVRRGEEEEERQI